MFAVSVTLWSNVGVCKTIGRFVPTKYNGIPAPLVSETPLNTSMNLEESYKSIIVGGSGHFSEHSFSFDRSSHEMVRKCMDVIDLSFTYKQKPKLHKVSQGKEGYSRPKTQLDD